MTGMTDVDAAIGLISLMVEAVADPVFSEGLKRRLQTIADEIARREYQMWQTGGEEVVDGLP